MSDQEDGRLSTADIANGVRDDRSTDEAGESPAEREGAPERAPLFAEDQATELRARWQEVQTKFVDDPRQAVQDADALVADLMKRLATTFADERNNLEDQWEHGDNVSTEDLRVTLQRYRSVFDRLLSL
jgi:hypothetical protein